MATEDPLAQPRSGDPETPRPPEGGALPADRLRVVFVWVLVFLAFRALVPFVRGVPPALAVLAGVPLFMLLSLFGPRLMAPLRLKAPQLALGFLLFAGITFGCATIAEHLRVRSVVVLLDAYSDLFLIFAAVFLGHLLASLFREPNLLVPAAVAAGLVDYWGVNYGTTQAIIKNAPAAVSKLSVHVPVAGMPVPLASIGFGDFVFFSLFLACALRFNLRERLIFWLSFVLLVASMMVVMIIGTNVPALVPMAVAFLLANIGRFRLQRSEVVAMLQAAGIVGGLLVIYLLVKVLLLRHG